MKSQVLTHGGDWAGFEEEYGYTPLDLSANVSPFGVPEGVKEAIRDGVEEADRYPDPLCRALRKAIAEARNTEASYCLCGNGAADLSLWRNGRKKRWSRGLPLRNTARRWKPWIAAWNRIF